jgi:zinc transport system substrate-binding protein
MFDANAAELRGELETLDAEFAAGLADCDDRTLVTAHDAFGYLADRYDLSQVGIAGLSPGAEPTPADLADISRFVADHGVTTIYTERLVSPAVADAVADETGASTAVLDPLEGLAEDAAGADYFTVMRANLASLRAGQGCR